LKREIPFTVSATLLLVLLAFTISAARLAPAATTQDLNSIAIEVFPKTLSPGRDPGTEITVLAKIPFRKINRASLTLNGIAAKSANPDDDGELIASFDKAAVGNNISYLNPILTLGGVTTEGVAFRGSDTVKVTRAR
jgi:hypothetical protein